jgi:hypothetical protein
MSTTCFYGRINDKLVPRIFMERYMINEFLEFYGKMKDKWVLCVVMGG